MPLQVVVRERLALSCQRATHLGQLAQVERVPIRCACLQGLQSLTKAGCQSNWRRAGLTKLYPDVALVRMLHRFVDQSLCLTANDMGLQPILGGHGCGSWQRG